MTEQRQLESGKLRAYVQEAMQHYEDVHTLQERIKDHKAMLKDIVQTISKDTALSVAEVNTFLALNQLNLDQLKVLRVEICKLLAQLEEKVEYELSDEEEFKLENEAYKIIIENIESFLVLVDCAIVVVEGK